MASVEGGRRNNADSEDSCQHGWRRKVELWQRTERAPNEKDGEMEREREGERWDNNKTVWVVPLFSILQLYNVCIWPLQKDETNGQMEREGSIIKEWIGKSSPVCYSTALEHFSLDSYDLMPPPCCFPCVHIQHYRDIDLTCFVFQLRSVPMNNFSDFY